MAKKTVWETLRSIDVSEYTKKKNGMTYLSWAHAWGALKDVYPDATFEKHVEEGNIPYMIDLTWVCLCACYCNCQWRKCY